MKIVFIVRVCPPYYSGAGQAMLNIAQNLVRRGEKVTLLACRFDERAVPRETIRGVPIFRFDVPANYYLSRFLFNLQCAWWLLRHSDACDVIQFESLPIIWLPVWLAAKWLDKPIFLRTSMLLENERAHVNRSLNERLWLKNIERAHGIIAMTRQLADSAADLFGRAQTIYHVPNPVDDRVFFPADACEKKRLRQRLGIDTKAKVAVFIGSVIERKGVDLLVEAWAKVIRTMPNTKLYMVGPRTFKNEFGFDNLGFTQQIDKRVEELNLNGQLIFTGSQDQKISDYLRMADVFVLPSRKEGLANAMLEAMASGLPCILCNQPWVPNHLIQHEETGFICEPTAEALADALIYAFSHPGQSEKVGRAAKKKIHQEHHPDVISKKLLQVYHHAVKD